MVTNVSDVLSVYKKTGGLIDQADSAPSTPVAGAGSFGDTLKGFLGDAVSTMHGGEQAALSAISGNKVDMAGVATAIGNAEVVLNEVVAIRDKVITAYQNITSTAI